MASHTPAILVVDDDEGIRDMLTGLLEDAGYEVDSAPDGEVALDLLEAQPTRFGLVILDLMMPNVNGYAFRELQHASPTIVHIPVVTLSASSIVRQRGFPKGIGPDRFLSKPVDIDAMLALVAHFCGPAQA